MREICTSGSMRGSSRAGVMPARCSLLYCFLRYARREERECSIRTVPLGLLFQKYREPVVPLVPRSSTGYDLSSRWDWHQPLRSGRSSKRPYE